MHVKKCKWSSKWMFINCANCKESSLTNPNMVIPICNWGNPPLQLKGILGKVLLMMVVLLMKTKIELS